MNSLPKTSQLGSALLIIAVVGALLSVAGTPLRPANLTCVTNEGALTLAFTQYVEDNDENCPPTNTIPAFQAAVLPYAQAHSVFVCPVTGADYMPNAALSETSLYSHDSNLGDLELFRDGQPHADGLLTIGYADSHIEHGGVNQIEPEQVCKTDAKQIALGIIQYTQDWDETLPPMHTAAEMQNAILPYVKSRGVFRSPVTGLPFTPNPDLSGQPLPNFPQPATVELFRDPRRHHDGKSVVAYLDGHIVEQ
jgi:prepilin-type processing-associated H-X9-DG protein